MYMKQRRNRKMIATLFYSYGKFIDICNYLNLTFGFPATPHKICLSYVPHKFTRRKNLREMEQKGNYLLSARLSAACAAIKAAVAKDLKGTGVAFFCPMRCI